MRHQRGITVMRAVLFVAIAGAAGFIALSIMPAFREYMAIRKSIHTIVTQGAEQSASDVRKSFDQAAASENIRSIKGSDLDVTKTEGNLVIAFSYRVEAPLIANLSLYFDFDGTTAPPEHQKEQ